VGGTFLPAITVNYTYYLSVSTRGSHRLFDFALIPRVYPPQDRTFAQMQAIITSLVFDHALRMRPKADTPTAGPKIGLSEEEEESTSAEDAKPKSTALAGMLNDLVTSDLDNLHNGNEFVNTREYQLFSFKS
jgi:hypothetical protein